VTDDKKVPDFLVHPVFLNKKRIYSKWSCTTGDMEPFTLVIHSVQPLMIAD